MSRSFLSRAALRVLVCVSSFALDVVLGLGYKICNAVRPRPAPEAPAAAPSSTGGAEAEDVRPALLLLHGSSGSQEQFLVSRFALEPHFRRVYAPDLLGACDIPAYARQVRDFVERAGVRGPLVVVGLSMGGLVGAHFAETFARDADARVSVQGVFTVCSPFGGAPLLSLVPDALKPARHRDMTPRSAFLRELRRRVRTSDTPYFMFGSDGDVHVPAEYSHLEKEAGYACGRRVQVHHRFGGHITMALRPAVYREIARLAQTCR